jgi:hypothetical protein
MTTMRSTALSTLTLLILVRPLSYAAASPCKIVDGSSKETTDLAKLVKEATGLDANVGWLKRVRSCKVGRYVVSGPADGSSNTLLVTKDSQFVTIIEPSQTLLFEGHNRLVTSLSDQNGDGHFDFLDYRGTNQASGEHFVAVDSDLDGRTDILALDGPAGASRYLFQIEGVWLERVNRDGQTGFVVDGEFVRTRDEAAALLRKQHGR